MNYHLTIEQCKTVAENAGQLLYEYCQNFGIHYTVVGVSGGLDSAVTLALASKARNLAAQDTYKLTPIGLIMPCHSNEQAEKLAWQAAKKFKVKTLKVDLTHTFDFIYNDRFSYLNAEIGAIRRQDTGPIDYKAAAWIEPIKITQGNVKARLRMITVYHVARLLNGLVLSTDNLSELWMGFWTICGDVGDFGLIQNMLKGSELYDLAAYLEVPPEIIAAKPDDGLDVANGDADQLGAEYPDVDLAMLTLLQAGFRPDGAATQLDNLPLVNGLDPKIVQSLAKRCLQTAYKRRGTINLSRQQLGLMPINSIPLE